MSLLYPESLIFNLLPCHLLNHPHSAHESTSFILKWLSSNAIFVLELIFPPYYFYLQISLQVIIIKEHTQNFSKLPNQLCDFCSQFHCQCLSHLLIVLFFFSYEIIFEKNTEEEEETNSKWHGQISIIYSNWYLCVW